MSQSLYALLCVGSLVVGAVLRVLTDGLDSLEVALAIDILWYGLITALSAWRLNDLGHKWIWAVVPGSFLVVLFLSGSKPSQVVMQEDDLEEQRVSRFVGELRKRRGN